MQIRKSVAIIGSGPAGLMAAHVIVSKGYSVKVFEKRPSAGRKILIAGSSGLNVSFDSPLTEFVKNYQGPRSRWEKVLKQFSPQHWVGFIQSLGLETFRGTSGRYFVKGMKGSTLLRAWVEFLKSRDVEFVFNSECIDFDVETGRVKLKFGKGSEEFSAVCFCLGGGSWEKGGGLLQWPEMFTSKGLKFENFQPSNCGFKVDWPGAFLKEAEGLPLKNISFSSKKGSRAGELVITNYGLEGTPIYALGEVGEVWIDLLPNQSPEELLKKLSVSKENLSPLRRVKKNLNLSPGKLALIFHLTPQETLTDLRKLVSRLKKFPLRLKERQPLEEAISSSGGLAWSELDDAHMLKKFPGVFAAGEMLDWDAPTGGFLIQGCVSQGYTAGLGISEYCSS